MIKKGKYIFNDLNLVIWKKKKCFKFVCYISVYRSTLEIKVAHNFECCIRGLLFLWLKQIKCLYDLISFSLLNDSV